MKSIHYPIVILIINCLLLLTPGCTAPVREIKGSVKQVTLSKFELQSSSLVSATGEIISKPGYKPDVYWFPVNVPSTVLTGLVANNVYPDPYAGMNNMLIPDASDEFNKTYDLEKFSHLPNDPNPWKKPYWYRTIFNIPAEDNGKHFKIIFKGINYRAAVWVNGIQLADSTQMSGMFAEYSLDASKIVVAGKANVMAVKIYPLDFPGLPAEEQLKALGDFFANGGPTGDIGKNVTMLCSVGWDWMPPVRDRNIGIWAPVYLRTTGAVTIAEPKIVTELPKLPDTTAASISLSLKLLNHNDSDGSGKLTVTISPENFTGESVQFTKDITMAKNAPALVDLNPANTSQLNLVNPHLWWPNGYGKPDLYRIRLQYADNSGISDDTTFVFGVRTVGTKALDVNGTYRRDFYVNGQRIHITGGAWVPDMMLNRDSLRYDYEFRLCRNSNINLVRIWGGGTTPRDEFWDSADRFGLLVWSDFWVTGDTQGEFKGSPDWPIEGDVFVKNVRSTILRIRNHPSLLLWTGGNEGHARKELYDAMRESIITLDGTRPYIPCSSGFAHLPDGWEGSYPDNLPSGAYSGGPYTWKDPKDYYNRAVAAKDWVFKDETGIPSQPPYNIMPKIIPNLVWDKKSPFPLNDTWGYHDAATGNGRFDLYYEEMVKRYGAPASMEDFCNKMQLMNAVGYQGIFEAAGHKLNDISGVMLWKLNAAFPSVVWQVYDWYLMPNAGYYFMQNAVEPVHIQLNLLNHDVLAINKTYKPLSDLTASVDIFDLSSRSIFHEEKKLSLGASEVTQALSVAKPLADANGVSFVVLNLKDKSGKVVSHNVYWLAKDENCTSLTGMAPTDVMVSVVNSVKSKTDYNWSITVTNSTDKIAFFVRPQLMAGGNEVLPSFWSGSYFTLAPKESTSLTVSCPVEQIGSDAPALKISGWNVPDQVLDLP
jgi:hypothetical protein